MATGTPICDFGWKAVDVTLPATDGQSYSILECAGPNGLLVAFICNPCPYVKAIIGRLVRDASELKPLGIGTVAICSNDAPAYPEDSFDNMKAFAQAHAFAFPYLHDEAQDAARAYGAVCTPDFFGFNRRPEVQYRGRPDATREERAAEGLRRDLVEAMKDVAQTGRGPQDQIPSMGCSIKWKAA